MTIVHDMVRAQVERRHVQNAILKISGRSPRRMRELRARVERRRVQIAILKISVGVIHESGFRCTDDELD